MHLPYDPAAYDDIVFIDSMVPLEGKPLADLPWGDLGLGPRLLLLVVPQVLREIDKRKRDGRLAKRSREFRRLVQPAALSGAPVRIVDAALTVDLGLAPSGRINWETLTDFDPDDGDARVVAQVLYEQGMPAGRKIFLSQDMLPIALASRSGLKVLRLPDEWLAPPEPSPHDKEVTKLKARVKELEASEPDLTVDVTFSVAAGYDAPIVAALTDGEQTALCVHLENSNRPLSQESAAFNFNYDSSYARRYETFISKKIPEHAANLHTHVQEHYAQIGLQLTIANVGSVHAENLMVSVSATGGILRERFLTHALFGVVAPRLRLRTDELVRSTMLNMPPLRDVVTGRHDVTIDLDENGAEDAKIQCEDFRQGWEWTWDGLALLDVPASVFSVDVSITASNMRGTRAKTFTLPLTSLPATVSDLVDVVAREYKRPMPLQERFDEAVEDADMDWLDFPDSD